MQPQYGNMTSDVMVVVVVEDVNDHPPTFGSNAPYTAFVREDAPLDSLIYFDGDGYISVFDADQVRGPKNIPYHHLLLSFAVGYCGRRNLDPLRLEFRAINNASLC